MDPEEKELAQKLQERFAQLPRTVQNAINSADVEKQLRSLADSHQLHVDQWELLENEVTLTLYGFQPVEKLAENIEREVGVSNEEAQILAADISNMVFGPIREELERQLEHPDAKAAQVSGVDAARTEILAGKSDPTANDIPVPAAVAPSAAPTAAPTPSPAATPATPPTPGPTEKAVRAPISEAYKAGEASSTRKSVHDDPYREPPL